MSTFKKIGNLFPSIQKSQSLASAVHAVGIVERAQRVLDALLGDDAPHVRATVYRDGALRVKCDRSLYAETVRLREQELREAINADFGREAIDRIVTK